MNQMKSSMGSRQHWMHSLYKNATGIRVLYAMGKETEDVSKKAFKEVLNLVSRDNTAFNQAGGEEFLAFHLITETMLPKRKVTIGQSGFQRFATRCLMCRMRMGVGQGTIALQVERSVLPRLASFCQLLIATCQFLRSSQINKPRPEFRNARDMNR